MKFVILILLCLVGLPLQAQSDFSVACGASSITFLRDDTPEIQVSFAQASIPLALAIESRENQPVVFGEGVSVWALRSNELQVHDDSDPDGTKFIVSSGICGAIPRPTDAEMTAIALAYSAGDGDALAFASVSPTGEAVSFAQVSGTGQALAFASSRSTLSTLPDGTNVHIVAAGENLFRIALRYGTTVSTLARLNNLSDPSRIYIGQVIRLP